LWVKNIFLLVSFWATVLTFHSFFKVTKLGRLRFQKGEGLKLNCLFLKKECDFSNFLIDGIFFVYTQVLTFTCWCFAHLLDTYKLTYAAYTVMYSLEK